MVGTIPRTDQYRIALIHMNIDGVNRIGLDVQTINFNDRHRMAFDPEMEHDHGTGI